jgi:hypothetical protein
MKKSSSKKDQNQLHLDFNKEAKNHSSISKEGGKVIQLNSRAHIYKRILNRTVK